MVMFIDMFVLIVHIYWICRAAGAMDRGTGFIQSAVLLLTGGQGWTDAFPVCLLHALFREEALPGDNAMLFAFPEQLIHMLFIKPQEYRDRPGSIIAMFRPRVSKEPTEETRSIHIFVRDRDGEGERDPFRYKAA